jgi:hypothetical protein
VSFVEIFREALWPAFWPAAITLSLLAVGQTVFRATLPSIVLQLGVSALLYFALFLLAVGREGRREYLRHLDVLLKRKRRPVAYAAAAAPRPAMTK